MLTKVKAIALGVHKVNFILAPEQNQQVFRSLLALDCLCRALGVLMRESQTLSRIPVNVLSEWTTDAGTKACISLGQLQRSPYYYLINYVLILNDIFRSLIWEVALKSRIKSQTPTPAVTPLSATSASSNTSSIDLLGSADSSTQQASLSSSPLPASMLISGSPSSSSHPPSLSSSPASVPIGPNTSRTTPTPAQDNNGTNLHTRNFFINILQK